MKLDVNAKYLVLPVSRHAARKKVLFRDETGKLIYDLDVRLDPVDAQHLYYVDMHPFLGMTLDISVSPEIDFEPEMAEEAPPVGGEMFRPRAHFTPAQGWINDPNGLIYYEGKYHLFYQYNPAGMYWDNMHWGHAVSDDLVHWEEKEIALYPDELGTMFSGCAIADERNLTGLQENEHAPMLLFYTAAGGTNELSQGKPVTQCLAYSTDGGETFKKYAGNPVVPHIVGGNRDPKVIWCPEIGAYVMALYLTERTYALLKSDNLLQWNLIQQIDIPGDDECPDFFPLELEDEKYWVLSGASDFYLVGKMTEEGFVPQQGVSRLNPEGGMGYAAQTYWGLADNRRVRFSWNRSELPGMSFNSSMQTPVDLFLSRIEGKIVLCARPVPEFEALYGRATSGKGCVKLPGQANDIRISVPAGEESVKISLMGLSMEICPAEGMMRMGKCAIHINAVDGVVPVRVIQDVHSMEFYSADGAGYVCVAHPADKALNYVQAPECASVEATELVDYRKTR